MPNIFKALATIIAWVLWVSSLIMLVSVVLMGIITGTMYGSESPPMVVPVFFLVATAQAVSAVVIMRLRQKME